MNGFILAIFEIPKSKKSEKLKSITENIEDLESRKSELIRVFVKGGIISPGDFQSIIQTAQKLGADCIHLGSRQDILFSINERNRTLLEETFKSIRTEYDSDGESYQNIVSSFTALDIMPTTHWLASHIYHYVLDTFDFRPKIKINITDPVQSLVPLFTGNVNFVASSIENYWYLYLRFSEIDPKPWCAPKLVYSYDLAKVAKKVEEIAPRKNNISYVDIFDEVLKISGANFHELEHKLAFPEPTSLYYEGMNRIAGGKYWLGLYWRNNRFSINFLNSMCKLCLDTNIGKLSLTPWKSLIVRGVEEKDRLSWEKVLGKFGINIRHSSLELNWHVPVLDVEAQEIKNYLVRKLDKMDISTYGLSFSIKTGHMISFTSVVIEKNDTFEEKAPATFSILYSRDFNPNQSEYFYFAKDVSLEIIPTLLLQLSYKYYDQLRIKSIEGKTETVENKNAEKTKKFQCSSCLTVYDEKLGDPSSGIAPGFEFVNLSSEYTCPICESPKSAFRLL